MTALIIRNKEMNDIMKIIKSVKDAGVLIKDVSKTIENEAKKPKKSRKPWLHNNNL